MPELTMPEQSHELMILQAWFSPAFPIGAFSYSHGLEAAIQDGLVVDAPTLERWIRLVLTHGSGRNDALFITAAYQHIPEANQLCLALSSSKERHLETSELGQAFCHILRASYDIDLPEGLAYPVAVGMAAYQKQLQLPLTIQSYLQAFVANLISVGVRAIPIGQQAGQQIMVAMYPAIKTVTSEAENSTLDSLGNAAFISDVMAMKHETSTPRIYRT